MAWIRLLIFLLACAGARAQTTNYSDIWWNPNESGWGLTIADHETQLFAVWYTYRSDGSPAWYVIPGGEFSQSRRIFTGTIYETRGPAHGADTFNPSLVTVTPVGTLQLDFAPGLGQGIALMTYSVAADGVFLSGAKRIERQPFGDAAPSWGNDLTDIWWNDAESGWGMTLAQHGKQVFGVLFVYEDDGRPLWIVMPGVAFDSATSFRGALYTARGPGLASPFNPSAVQISEAGEATITLDPSVNEAKILSRGRLSTRFRNRVKLRDIAPQPFGAARPTQRSSFVFESPGPLSVRRGQPVMYCYCRPDPGNSPCGIVDGHQMPRGGTPPYTFVTRNSFPPLGLALNPSRGCFTGAVSDSLATPSGQFTVCARDLGGREACTVTTWVLAEDQPPVVGMCNGTGTITVSGTLTVPNGACPQPFQRQANPSVEITMDWSDFTAPQQTLVDIGNGGFWLCQNLSPAALPQAHGPMITLTRNGNAIAGTGSETIGQNRFDISFTGDAGGVTGAISYAYRDPGVGANWQYSGTFACRR